MSEAGSVLISLDEKHAKNVFNGSKLIEFRRRTMSVEDGSSMWIYVKKPVGMVLGFVVVKRKHRLPLESMWSAFSTVSGITEREFYDYFEGLDSAFGVEFLEVELLDQPVSLEAIKRVDGGFRPPQFFMKLAYNGPVHKLLIEAVSSQKDGCFQAVANV